MNRCIPHQLRGSPQSPAAGFLISEQLHTVSQTGDQPSMLLFLYLRVPSPAEESDPNPSPGFLPIFGLHQIFLWITDFNFIVTKAKHTWYLQLGTGDQNEGEKNKTGERTSYLVLRIFRNCKISENWISLRALKNLKPGKTNETDALFSVCGFNVHTLLRDLQLPGSKADEVVVED